MSFSLFVGFVSCICLRSPVLESLFLFLSYLVLLLSCCHMSSHISFVVLFLGCRGNLHVGHVYLPCLMPRCCSRSMAVGYFLLQYGQYVICRAIGSHVCFVSMYGAAMFCISYARGPIAGESVSRATPPW